MKYVVRQSLSSLSGYEFVEIDGDKESVTPINEVALEKKTCISWLKLPENATNRKLLNPAKVEKHGGCVELTHKEPIVLGPRDNSTPRKKLEDYLTDEEKATIEAIMNRARERKEADKAKPMTEIEKAEAKLAKLQAKLEALKAAKAQEEVETEEEEA